MVLKTASDSIHSLSLVVSCWNTS